MGYWYSFDTLLIYTLKDFSQLIIYRNSEVTDANIAMFMKRKKKRKEKNEKACENIAQYFK